MAYPYQDRPVSVPYDGGDWRSYVRSESMDDRVLSYVDVGDGPALLLVHGLGGSWQTWLENLSAWSASHRVIAVDLPGFGGSDPLPPSSAMDSYVNALAELLDRLGVRSAVLAGHSLGGLVVALFAQRFPERTDALVLVSAGAIRMSPLRLSAVTSSFGVLNSLLGQSRVLELISERAALSWVFLRPMVRAPRLVPRALLAQVIPATRPPSFLAALTSAAAALPDVRPDLVKCPCLLIWGRNDLIIPVPRAVQLAAELPNARLAVLGDVGHCAMFEWPEAVNELVIEFLDDVRTVPRIPTSEPSQLNPTTASKGLPNPVAWYPRQRRSTVVLDGTRLFLAALRHLKPTLDAALTGRAHHTGTDKN